MPYVFVPLPVRQKLNEFRTFLLEHEYHESTILGYHTYVSRFLRSGYFNEKNANITDQITEFLKNEALMAPKTFKDCRAALYAFHKSLMGVAYPNCKRSRQC
jgi:hypothetical protein